MPVTAHSSSMARLFKAALAFFWPAWCFQMRRPAQNTPMLSAIVVEVLARGGSLVDDRSPTLYAYRPRALPIRLQSPSHHQLCLCVCQCVCQLFCVWGIVANFQVALLYIRGHLRRLTGVTGIICQSSLSITLSFVSWRVTQPAGVRLNYACRSKKSLSNHLA